VHIFFTVAFGGVGAFYSDISWKDFSLVARINGNNTWTTDTLVD